jgi:hypothetical protein
VTPLIRAASLACLGILLIGCPAAAQERGIGFGVKGGVNLATQSTAGTAGSTPLDTRTGILAGGFVTVPLGSRLDLQAEGLYALKGAKLTFQGIGSTLALDYLEVPLLARWRLTGGHRRLFAAGGIAPALRLRARALTTFSGSTEALDVADQVERLDLGAVAGGGVEIGSLILDARYTLGLRNVDTAAAGSDRTRNRAISLAAGFRF